MKKLFVVPLILVVAGALIFGGCAGEAPPTEGPPTEGPPTEGPPVVKTLKVGFTGPLSGVGAAWGLNQARGQRIWAACINDGRLAEYSENVDPEGGLIVGGEKYMIELIEYDDRGEPTGTLDAVKKLALDDKCYIQFPSITWAAGALGDLCQSEGIFMIQTAGDPRIIGPGRTLVFNGNNDEHCYNQAMTWYALTQHPDAQRIALVSPDVACGHYGISWAWKVVEKDFNREVVFDGLYPIDTVDYHPFMASVLATNPDMIIGPCCWPNDTALCIEAAYEAGYEGYWCTNTYVLSLILPRVPAEYLEGFSGGWTYGGWQDNPGIPGEGLWFIDQWNAEYGAEEWTTSSPGNYAACRVVQAGIEAADSVDPYDIAAALEAMDPVPHPMGPAMWSGEHFWGINHGLLVPMCTYEIHDGKYVSKDIYTAPYPWDFDLTGVDIPQEHLDAVLELWGRLD